MSAQSGAWGLAGVLFVAGMVAAPALTLGIVALAGALYWVRS